MDFAFRSRHAGNAELTHGFLRRDLVAHHADMIGGRADKLDAMSRDDIDEFGIFRQEAIARMDGVRIGHFRRRDDRRDIEIALRRARRADTDAFIGETHMHGIRIGGGMDGDRLDAHLAAGAMNTERDFAAIGDQDFFKHRTCQRYSRMTSG